MEHIDLSYFTLILLIITVCIVPIIKARTVKRTWTIRLLFIVTAVLIFTFVVLLSLRPIPANGDTVVYLTNTGSKYHAASCSHLRKSKIKTTLAEAVALKYDDCSHCYTPEYIPETMQPSFADLFKLSSLQHIILFILVIISYFAIFCIPGLISEWKKR